MSFDNEYDRIKFENLLKEMSELLNDNEIQFNLTTASVEKQDNEKVGLMFNNFNSFNKIIDIHSFLTTNLELFQITYEKSLDLQYLYEYIKSEIPNGIYVLCIDSSEKPEDFFGDWLERHRQYKIIDVYYNLLDDRLTYKLEGMVCNDPYHGYNSRRFDFVSKAILN
jgi:hypothetical protein